MRNRKYTTYYSELLSLDWYCDKNSELPYYKQFAEFMKYRMHRGDIPAHFTLPPLARLAKLYNISRNSLIQAMELLESEGYITKTSKGLKSAYPPDKSTLNWMYYIKRDDIFVAKNLVTTALEHVSRMEKSHRNGMIHPCYGFDRFNAQMVKFHGNGDAPDIIASLPAHLARYGISAGVDEIAISQSSQLMLHLLSMCIKDTGATYIIPETSRLSVRIALEASRLSVRYIKCDQKGPLTDDLYKQIVRSEKAVLLFEPGSMWPYGRPCDTERTKQIASVCEAKNTPIVELDYSHEHRASGYIPLKAMDVSGNILYLSSILSLFSPMDHIAFAVGSSELIGRLTAFSEYCFPSSYLSQSAIAEVIRNRKYFEFIEEHRAELFSYYDKVQAVMVKYLSGLATWSKPVNDVYLKVDFMTDISGIEPDYRLCLWLHGEICGKDCKKSLILVISSCTIEEFELFIVRLAEEIKAK